jgi:aminoglycoside phosphotransferase (APT) family kinase protein
LPQHHHHGEVSITVSQPRLVRNGRDLRGSIKRWFPRAKRMSRDQTTLHGDFHRGNIFYHKPTLDATGALGVADLVAIDWAMFGRGHAAHELVYFFNTSVDRQRAVDVTPEAALAEVLCMLH